MSIELKNANKKRLPNFSTEEKITLVEIIESKKNIIENKQTDNIRTKEKEKYWQDVSREFNSRCISVNRNIISLKNYWDNLKKRTRKHCAEIRKEIFATGGGKMTLKDDLVAERVKNIIQPSITGLLNPFDSDYIIDVDDVNVDTPDKDTPDKDTPDKDTPDKDTPVFSEIETFDETGSTNSNWVNWTPTALRSKKSTELQVSIYNNEEDPDLELFSYDEVETTLRTLSKENRLATSPACSNIKSKTVKRKRQTRMSIISAVKRNQCFFYLARSKAELVELMKEDLRAKSKIQIEILETQLEKEKLEVELLKNNFYHKRNKLLFFILT